MGKERKPLRMDSVTNEDIDPNSLLGRAILSGDRETVKRITKGLKEDRNDLAAMEEWAHADFASKGLTIEDERASLELPEEDQA